MYIKNGKYKSYLEIYNKNIEQGDTPIIIIHGGPGASLNYLVPISDIKINEPIIYYDQINSGKSLSKYQNNEIELYHFIEQLEIIVKKLKIKKCHLIGHSFGCIIAQEFYLKNKSNVETIIFYSPSLSLELWQKQADIYMESIMEKTEYHNYNLEYTKRHIGDLNVMSKYIDSFNHSLYNHLWGENEYTVNGIIKNYEYQPITTNIQILFLSGEYDTSSENVLIELSRKMKNYRIEVLNDTRHISHLEKPKEFNNILISFFKNYYKNKFNKRHIYYEQEILNNNSKNEEILSNKLIYIYITYAKNKEKLDGLLEDINNCINMNKKKKDMQSFLDFWYFTKILGYKDKYKPNKLFLEDVFRTIENRVINPYDALLNYIYIRILMYCEKKDYPKEYFNSLEDIIKKDLIIYGYYLTHIILYDLKFGYINISELPNKSNINWAIDELNILLSNNNLFYTVYADLLGEISFCFQLCNIQNDLLYLYIYNVLNRVEPENFHLTNVLGVLSY